MTLASSIKQFVENIARSARIISPRFADYRIEGFDFYSESGQFDETFKAEVVNIIKEEIKIQMTEVREDEEKSKVDPSGSVPSQVQQNVRKAISIADNPEQVGSLLISKLPQAALLALAISLYPIIIEHLTRAGGIMDTRFRRKIELEWNGFLDRQTQKNTQIGLRSMIVQSNAGFIQINGAGSGNAQRMAKNTQGFIEKTSEIGLPSVALRYDGTN